MFKFSRGGALFFRMNVLEDPNPLAPKPRDERGFLSGNEGFKYWSLTPLEVRHRVLSHLTFDEHRAMGLLDNEGRALFADIYAHTFKKVFDRYSLPFTILLPAMKEIKAVATGPVILNVLGASDRPAEHGDHCFDFYVPKGSLDKMEDFIVKCTPYRRTPLRLQSVEDWENDGCYGARGIDPIYDTGSDTGILEVRLYVNSDNNHSFTVMESTTSLALTAVFMCPTTLGMTYMTWNGIVCPYPKMYLRGFGLMNTHKWMQNNNIRAWTMKYMKRGHPTVSDSLGGFMKGHNCTVSPYCSRTMRSMSDGASFFLPFNLTEPVDPIDPGLIWQLSTRTFCFGSSKFGIGAPLSFYGMVLSTTGQYIRMSAYPVRSQYGFLLTNTDQTTPTDRHLLVRDDNTDDESDL